MLRISCSAMMFCGRRRREGTEAEKQRQRDEEVKSDFQSRLSPARALHGKTKQIYHLISCENIITAAQLWFGSVREPLTWNLSSGNVTGEHSDFVFVLIKASRRRELLNIKASEKKFRVSAHIRKTWFLVGSCFCTKCRKSQQHYSWDWFVVYWPFFLSLNDNQTWSLGHSECSRVQLVATSTMTRTRLMKTDDLVPKIKPQHSVVSVPS